MTKSQKILKEIEELRANHHQRTLERRAELWRENITNKEREKLHKESKEEGEKFEKEIRERLLSDLSNWFFDPQGFFRRIGEELKPLYWEKGTHNDVPTTDLGFYNENYKKEIINEFINEIKQKPQDWKIEVDEESVINGFYYYKCWVAKHKSGRKHYRPFSLEEKGGHDLFSSFTPEEWTEIKNAINNNQKQEKDQNQSITPPNRPQTPQPKEKPVENKPTDKLPNSPSEIISLLLQYFQNKRIKRITLTDEENLEIEYEDGHISTNHSIDNIDQEKVKNYLQSRNDKTISYQELELSNNSDTATTKSPDNNNTLWIVLGIGGILIVIVIIGLLLRKNRVKKH